jgi:hypothetical protein
MGTMKPLGWYLGTIDTLQSSFALICIYWYKLDCKSFLGQIFYAALKSVCNTMTVRFLQIDVYIYTQTLLFNFESPSERCSG